MIARIFNIAWKELLHLRKDRVLIPFLIIGALAELALLAWATSQPVDDLRMAVVDHDNSEASHALVAELDSTATLDYDSEDRVDNVDAVYERMETTNTLFNMMTGHKTAMIGVVIPEGYGEQLAAGQQPAVRLILNGAEGVGSVEAERVAESIIFEEGMRQRPPHLEPADYQDQLPQITVRYNEDLERSWYTLPAEMALMFYMLTVVLAALAISREREKGTYEQLLVMPFRSIEVIIGKTIAPMLVGYTLFLTMLGLTVFVFNVPFRGSIPLLLVLAIVYLIAEMGKGVLVSMTSGTQLQAVLLVFVIMMVDIIFSGYAVAVETMPPFIQTLANFVSIRHWLIIVRGIMLKDAGLDVLYPNILAMIAIGSVILTFTAFQYRRNFN